MKKLEATQQQILQLTGVSPKLTPRQATLFVEQGLVTESNMICNVPKKRIYSWKNLIEFELGRLLHGAFNVPISMVKELILDLHKHGFFLFPDQVRELKELGRQKAEPDIGLSSLRQILETNYGIPGPKGKIDGQYKSIDGKKVWYEYTKKNKLG